MNAEEEKEKEKERDIGPDMGFGNFKVHPQVTYLLQQDNS